VKHYRRFCTTGDDDRLIGDLLRGYCSRRPPWRWLVVAITLVAFAQASFLTQTHLHSPGLPFSSAAQGQSEHGKAPQRDDPAHCPFCQEYLVAGAYLSPAPVLLPLPVAGVVLTIIAAREFPFLVTLSHAWHGRAPPPR